MKRYILIIPNGSHSAKFEADSLQQIAAMVCLGDKYTVIDTWTGATKSNHKLEINAVLL